MATKKQVKQEERTGLEDVTRSVRRLARSTRDVGQSAAEVAERELAMAIDVAASIRDRVISEESLREARTHELAARLRRDAHETVDLVMDVGTMVTLNVVRFFERFVDEPRPELEESASSRA